MPFRTTQRATAALMPSSMVLEICAESIESAIAAERGGAHRIELCTGRALGGLTPTPALIAAVRSSITIPLHILIRPRAGDFLYSDAEFEIMQQEILAAKQAGVQGVVFGILKPDGTVDTKRSLHLVELARPLSVTFHRAFDMANDLSRALEDIIAIGINRVLTSGGEQTAEAGIPAIATLTKQAHGRIGIMAGSGITQNNVREIIAATGVREIHATARTAAPILMQYRNDRVSMGTIKNQEYERLTTSEDQVSHLLAAALQQ
jgi:copper homeostasis protein